MSEIRDLKRKLAALEEAERRSKAARWKRAEELWSLADFTAAQIAEETGFSRAILYKRLGPRGTPRFGR